MNHSSVSTYLKRLVLTIVRKDANCRPSIADIKEVLCFVGNGEHGKLDVPLKPMITIQNRETTSVFIPLVDSTE